MAASISPKHATQLTKSFSRAPGDPTYRDNGGKPQAETCGVRLAPPELPSMLRRQEARNREEP